MSTDPDDDRERRLRDLADSTYDEILRRERARIGAETARVATLPVHQRRRVTLIAGERDFEVDATPSSELLCHPEARIVALVQALRTKLGSHHQAVAAAQLSQRCRADEMLIKNLTRLGRDKETKRDKELREQVEGLGWEFQRDVEHERDLQSWLRPRWDEIRDVLGVVPGRAGRPRSPLFREECERAARRFEALVNAGGPAHEEERRQKLNEKLSKTWSMRYHDVERMSYEDLGAHEAAYGSAPDMPVTETYRKLSQRLDADFSRRNPRD